MSEKKTQQPLITDLASIGLILKNKREERSYTLEHVSEITRITLTNLRNIENGKLESLPGLVFVRGFIRNYAKLVGVESDWMIEALNQTFTNREQPVDGRSKIAKQQALPIREYNLNKYLLVGAMTAIIVALAVIYWNVTTDNQYSSMTERVETVQAVENKTITAEEILKAVDIGTGGKSVAENQASPAPVISPLTLTLVAQENDWIRISVDGQEPEELELTNGEKYEWPASKEYMLTMTTGSSALVHLNGEEIVDRENFKDQLFQTKLNKFTLTQMNNR